jgi:protein arginine N-methyltransferase 7
MEEISRAVQAARYNEAVVVEVEGQEIVLVATLEPTTGGVVWRDAAAGEKDVGIIRHLRTKRWVLPMLNDTTRNTCYQEAIQQACQELKEKKLTENGITVLDIGSGTGLLAMMASKYASEALDTKKEVKVISLEMANAMARLARRTVTANDLDSIKILEEHSCEMPPLNQKAMLCTSELLESGLLGEGIIPALRDAWERHLEPNALVVPQRARVYAQLLENKEWIGAYAGPQVDFDLGEGVAPMRLSTSSHDEPLSGNVAGFLVPLHAQFLLQDDQTRVFTEPTMVMDFDFTAADTIPAPEGRSRSHSVSSKASGTVHGVLFWWELDLWKDITYSTEYGKQAWQDHWQQCLYVFASPIQVQEGNDLCLTCHHTDSCISFSLADTQEQEAKRAKTIIETSQLTPLRASILSDGTRLTKIQNAISSTLAKIGHDALVLDLSDFSLCGILAALAGAKRVVSLEGCSGDLPMMAARVAQLGNQLPREGAAFEILQCHAESLSLELLGGSPASLVVSEPYYELLEGWHLQEAINYYYLLNALKLRGLVANDFVSIPSYARIMGCAIQSDSIHGAYKGCGNEESESICGFDHSIVNQFAARYHEYDLSIPLWQYQYTALTDSFEIANLNYNTLMIEGNGEWREAPFINKSADGGTCHGLMYWIEYGLDSNNSTSVMMISTRTRPCNQGVRLLKTPCRVDESQMFQCRLTVGADDDLSNHEIHKIDLQVLPNKT